MAVVCSVQAVARQAHNPDLNGSRTTTAGANDIVVGERVACAARVVNRTRAHNTRSWDVYNDPPEAAKALTAPDLKTYLCPALVSREHLQD